jgi:asparagine synthase (glutamine-hydrolysing)
MLGSLEHRGRASKWICDSVAIGSLGQAPVEHEIRNLAIVADARLDNRRELIDGLGIDDPKISDAALIMEAYARWGEACVDKLIGDLAFAIWDGDRRRFFCARDHFGIRPFYYCATPGLVAFASEVKGLLAIPGVPRRLDENTVLEYLCAWWEGKDRTFYQDIKRLPPAHALTIDAHDATPNCYWKLAVDEPLNLKSDADYIDAFRSHFTEAVRSRMQTDDVFGSTLSGGLDSSSIACTARNLLGGSQEKLHTFSVIFDDVPKSDEREYQRAVIDGGRIEPHFVHGDRIGPQHQIDLLMDHMGGPFLGPNIFLHLAMYQSARDAGVTALFDGLDGDSTVSHGLARLTELTASGRWGTLVKEARRVGPALGMSPLSLLRYRAYLPFAPAGMRSTWQRVRGTQTPQDPPTPLNPDFQERLFQGPLRQELLGEKRPIWRSERDEHQWILERGIVTRAIELEDACSAINGISTRYPFFDKRLIEFCVRVPSYLKLRDGWTRWVLRQSMTGILPPAIQWRPGTPWTNTICKTSKPHLTQATDG